VLKHNAKYMLEQFEVGKYIIVWVKWPERGTDEFNTMSMLRL